MKLYYTPNSPYARICRVLALERGLRDRVAFELTTVRDPASPLLALNPSGKVPTLATDDGFVLAETRIICEHFDAIGAAAPLIVPNDLRQRHCEGLVFNMLDGMAVWLRETGRPANEQSPGVIELERVRARRCLNKLEDETPRWLEGNAVTFSRIAAACTIGFADARMPQIAWRTARPKLAAWFDVFNARPSMAETAPQAT